MRTFKISLKDSKEAVYGALDAWVAWEQTFPLASLRRALILLEKEQQWHKVVQLGDFGLAKWKTNGDSVQTRVLGTFAYLAPEYAEDGIVSVKMDVYAFGVVLLQLILGHGVFGSRERNQPSLLQWGLLSQYEW